jgi:glutamyl-tRNA reductase
VTIVLVGINHQTAPVEVRERFSPPPQSWPALNEKLVCQPELDEALILATCNRTELIGMAEETTTGLERLCQFFREEIGQGGLDSRHLYRLSAMDAALHLFRVAASLDSMVLGEAQILGQVKNAYRAGVEARSCGPVLNRLFERAFRVAKRVRTETGLGASSVSVARVGVQLARELFESFDGKRVLLLGAGEMAESALLGLQEAGVGSVVLANRTLAAAERLAMRVGGRPVSLDALEVELSRADVLLASVQVPEPLLTRPLLERVLAGRLGTPLLVIDLGLPRNVAPDANEIANLYLYDIDDLEGLAERGRQRRKDAVQAAEAILGRELERFESWMATLPVVPSIRELVARAEALASEEVQRSLSRLPENDPATHEAMQRLAEAIVHRFLHRPLVRLRDAAGSEAGAYYADALQQLFALEDDE